MFDFRNALIKLYISGGKKLPQANRRANIVLNNKIRKERVRKRLNKKKTSPKNSKVTMRKMKIELKQVRKRIQTTTMKPKLTTNNIRHSNSQFPRTNTRSSFLRPLITTTPNSLRATLPRRSTTKAPPAMKKGIALNPNPRSRETKNNASSGTISRNKFTTALPRNSVKKVTEINNFAGHNNTGGLTPLIQMFPGMVARGSGPRFGFGFTKIKESSRGQHVQRNFHDNPLFLEISRQILKSRDRIQFSNRSQSSTSQFMNGFRKFNDTPEKTTSFKINPRSSSSRFVFPKLGNDISFPIKHRIIETITPKPILMTGRRQEDITELKAKRNGGNRGRTDFRSNPSSISRGNQAFFIPETRLIPPDNIMITDRLVPPAINSVSAKNNSTDDEDHMTMMFQETKHDTARTLGGFFLNPDCPKCHPAFLSPGRCSPCVRIR